MKLESCSRTAVPYHTPLYPQVTVHPFPLQFAGTGILSTGPTPAGTTTAAQTSSTGSLITTLQDLTALLRWGFPGQFRSGGLLFHPGLLSACICLGVRARAMLALFPWQIISKELWPNPLLFYHRRGVPGMGPDRRAGEYMFVGWGGAPCWNLGTHKSGDT